MLKLTISAQPKRNYALLVVPLRFTVSTSSDAAENLDANGLLDCKEISANNSLNGSKNLPPQTPPRAHMSSHQFSLENSSSSARKNDFSGHLATMRSPFFCRGGQNRGGNFSQSSSFPEDLGTWFSTGTPSESGSAASSPKPPHSQVMKTSATTPALMDTSRAVDSSASTGPNRKRAIMQEQENPDGTSLQSVPDVPEQKNLRSEQAHQAGGGPDTITPAVLNKRMDMNDCIPAMGIRRNIDWESSTAVSSGQTSPSQSEDTNRGSKEGPKGLLRKTPTASDGNFEVSSTSTRKHPTQLVWKRFQTTQNFKLVTLATSYSPQDRHFLFCPSRPLYQADPGSSRLFGPLSSQHAITRQLTFDFLTTAAE